uniref:Uncharacterized protein n=1 Tax=Ascaris lumbricoides TaxID=6252 RepID=A0A0M3HH38_ASCLU
MNCSKYSNFNLLMPLILKAMMRKMILFLLINGHFLVLFYFLLQSSLLSVS